jgi:tetratricopeptide (TPR) repeat protein
VSDALYERYKDALRRGHVAALRGRLDAALAAYGEAAEVAPERALPHSSRGRVLHRLGRPDEALAAYDAALERSAHDETALSGRADTLAALGHRVEAADALDRLAESLARAGRLADACDTARKALELAESRTRRQFVGHLVDQLRGSTADVSAVAALERALQILEPVVGPQTTRPDGAREVATPTTEPATVDEPDRGIELTGEAEVALLSGDRDAARTHCLAAAMAHQAAHRIDAAIDACYLGLSIVPDDAALHLVLAELYVERGWRGPAAEKLLLLGRLVELDGNPAARERLCALVGARFSDDPRLTALCS